MTPIYEIPEIQDEAARRIEAIDTTTPHDLTQGADATFRRHPVPLTGLSDVSGLQRHLLFSATVERGDGRGTANNPEGDFVVIDGPLVVVFFARIRPGAQQGDGDIAAWAMHAVNRAILASWPGVGRFPLTPWLPGPIVNEWMTVTMRYQLSFAMPA